MFSILKKLFGKPALKPPPVFAPAPLPHVHPESIAIPSVEVAHLSLAAIIRRLPEEMKALVRQPPAETATVALPVATIMKQLPSACVKMSLASLHRQAHGVFAPLPPGDKRTVEIPLSEVFRHISPYGFKRRHDQRPFQAPENSFNLFGNPENPREIHPAAAENASSSHGPSDASRGNPSGIRLEAEMQAQLSPGFKGNGAPVPPDSAPTSSADPVKPLRTLAPPPGIVSLASARQTPDAEPPLEAAAPVVLPIVQISGSWPGEIQEALKEAIAAGAGVSLSAARLSEGLAKGRVTFPWGQICASLTSGAIPPGEIDEQTSLLIPLRVVAPAFLSSAKQIKAARKSVCLDVSIPPLFSGRNGKEHSSSASDPENSAPSDVASAPSDPDEAPHPKILEPAEKIAKLPETVGEVFGNPEKRDWTPTEIVQNTARLPGVSGAVVALQEGLQVASCLPSGVKSEVVAAFLPQIFARLNQYAGEMRLGEVDDLLFTTHGAHCQIYRLGYVYFAILGKPGEALPWHELRLISEELARQTRK